MNFVLKTRDCVSKTTHCCINNDECLQDILERAKHKLVQSELVIGGMDTGAKRGQRSNDRFTTVLRAFSEGFSE